MVHQFLQTSKYLVISQLLVKLNVNLNAFQLVANVQMGNTALQGMVRPILEPVIHVLPILSTVITCLVSMNLVQINALVNAFQMKKLLLLTQRLQVNIIHLVVQQMQLTETNRPTFQDSVFAVATKFALENLVQM